MWWQIKWISIQFTDFCFMVLPLTVNLKIKFHVKFSSYMVAKFFKATMCIVSVYHPDASRWWCYYSNQATLLHIFTICMQLFPSFIKLYSWLMISYITAVWCSCKQISVVVDKFILRISLASSLKYWYYDHQLNLRQSEPLPTSELLFGPAGWLFLHLSKSMLWTWPLSMYHTINILQANLVDTSIP